MVGLEGKRVGGVSIGAPGKDGPEESRKYPTGAVSGRGNHWAHWGQWMQGSRGSVLGHWGAWGAWGGDRPRLASSLAPRSSRLFVWPGSKVDWARLERRSEAAFSAGIMAGAGEDKRFPHPIRPSTFPSHTRRGVNITPRILPSNTYRSFTEASCSANIASLG